MRQRIIFSITMSLILSSLMTAWVTIVNLGLGPHFIGNWLHAFSLSWPAAAVISFTIKPAVQRFTARMTRQTECQEPSATSQSSSLAR